MERFNRTVQVAWLGLRPCAGDEERAAAIADFLNTYHHARFHGAPGNKPPASRVPITTCRPAPHPGNFATPRMEGPGHEPTLADPLWTTIVRRNS